MAPINQPNRIPVNPRPNPSPSIAPVITKSPRPSWVIPFVAVLISLVLILGVILIFALVNKESVNTTSGADSSKVSSNEPSPTTSSSSTVISNEFKCINDQDCKTEFNNDSYSCASNGKCVYTRIIVVSPEEPDQTSNVREKDIPFWEYFSSNN